MPKYLISEETAREQLDLFCDWYGIDLEEISDLASSDPDSPDAMKYATGKIIKAIRLGIVEVQPAELSDGEPTLHVKQTLKHALQKGKLAEITYHEVTGRMRAQVRTTKDMNRTAEMYQLLGGIAKIPASTFLELRGADLGIVDSLGFLFLLV